MLVGVQSRLVREHMLQRNVKVKGERWSYPQKTPVSVQNVKRIKKRKHVTLKGIGLWTLKL